VVEPVETTRIVGCSRGKAKAAWVLVVERVEAPRRCTALPARGLIDVVDRAIARGQIVRRKS
jgi:hypothetical protein